MFLNLYSEAKVCRYLSNFRDQFQLRLTFASFDVLESLGGGDRWVFLRFDIYGACIYTKKGARTTTEPFGHVQTLKYTP